MRRRAWRRGAPLPCREVVELLTDYLDDALPEQVAARVRAHLERCEGCETYLLQLRETVRVLADAPAPTLAEQICLDLLAALRGRDRA